MATTKKTASKKTATKAASKKKVTKKAPAKKTTKKATAKKRSNPGERQGSKMAEAVIVFEESWKDYCDGKIQRKDIIKRFIEEVGLTKAGASTYFQTLKTRFLEDEMN